MFYRVTLEKMSSKNVIDLRGGAQRPAPQPSLDLPRPRERPGKRISPVRVRRRRTRLIVGLVVLVILIAAVYGVSWVSYLPQYSVQTVTVEGTQVVPSKLVHDFVESQLYPGTHPFLSKDNIFLYNPRALEREIVGFFPRIAAATVSRASPFSTTVTVAVQERQPFALWCSDTTESDCYEMDSTGFIFAASNAVNATNTAGAPGISVASSTTAASNAVGSSDIPVASSTLTAFDAAATSTSTSANLIAQTPKQYVFQGGIGTSTNASTPPNPIGQTFVGAHMPGIIALLQRLSLSQFTPLGATVENAQDFWIPLTQGFYIKASFGEDPENIVSDLQLVLSSDVLAGKANQLEYIDLRFGDRVYYKLRGAAEVQKQ